MASDWAGPPSGESILADVQAMIRQLQTDKACGPYELHIPLSHLNYCTTARLRRMVTENDDVRLKNYVYSILLKRKRR